MTSVWERAADLYEGKRHAYPTPGALAAKLDRRTVQTPALDEIDAFLAEIAATPDGRGIITMPPQEGKSTRVAKDFVIWKLLDDPDCRVVTASYGQSLANRNGRAIRNTLTAHPELGLRLAPDAGAVHEWQLAGHDGGVLSVGIGAGVTGRPADLLIIDDPIKDRKEADSETYRQSVWDWWTDSAATRLAPGAPVVLILTRWHQDDLAGRLLKAAEEEGAEQWRVLNISAQWEIDEKHPERVDPLGREPGEYMQSARRRTVRQWEVIKRRSGSRTWNALYQGNPGTPGGSVFHRDWFRFYEQPLWFVRDDGSRVVVDYDDMLISVDCAFKDLDDSDFVAMGVWMRRDADAFLLDRVNKQLDFVATCRELVLLSARWPQAVLKLVEDKANGTAVIASLRHRVPGIVPEEPHGSKEARAAAISPLVESGNVYLPDPQLAPWVVDYLDQMEEFPTGAHDDEVDQTSQALNRLVLQPLLAGGIVTAVEALPELADHASYMPRI